MFFLFLSSPFHSFSSLLFDEGEKSKFCIQYQQCVTPEQTFEGNGSKGRKKVNNRESNNLI